MGKLIDGERRRQARAERDRRQRAILEAARSAFLSQQPGEVSLEGLDRASGLRQGAASMYFGSLEGLAVRLLREELASWLERLESALGREEYPLSPPELGRVLASTLVEAPLLCRLQAALPGLADRRTAEMDQLLDLELWRLDRFRETASRVASRCPGLDAAGGFLLLRRAILLGAALDPLITPPSGLLLAMNDKALSPLYPNPGDELESLLTLILEGMLSAR